MQKFYFRDIEDKPTTIDYLEVQSYEMNVYLVYLTVGNHSGMLYDNKDKPMRFFSAGHIREAFAHCNVSRASCSAGGDEARYALR